MNESSFGVMQIFSHTPAWASKMQAALTALWLIYSYALTNGVILEPQVMQAKIAGIYGLCMFAMQMFGVKPTAAAQPQNRTAV